MRWDQNGERLASSSIDGVVQVLDVGSGKVIYTGETEHQRKSFVIYLPIILIIYYRACYVNMLSLKRADKK